MRQVMLSRKVVSVSGFHDVGVLWWGIGTLLNVVVIILFNVVVLPFFNLIQMIIICDVILSLFLSLNCNLIFNKREDFNTWVKLLSDPFCLHEQTKQSRGLYYTASYQTKDPVYMLFYIQAKRVNTHNLYFN